MQDAIMCVFTVQVRIYYRHNVIPLYIAPNQPATLVLCTKAGGGRSPIEQQVAIASPVIVTEMEEPPTVALSLLGVTSVTYSWVTRTIVINYTSVTSALGSMNR